MTEEGKFSRAINKSRQERQKSSDGDQERPRRGHLSEAYDTGRRSTTSKEIRRSDMTPGEPDGSVVMYHDKWGEAASQIRGMCHKLLGRIGEKRPQVITVTSGSRREGKTIMTLNLAAALAEAEEGRILVLDSDLRGPGIYRLANMKPDAGLPDILHGDVELDGNICETRIPRVDIISSPKTADLNGQQGLLAKRCRALLNRVRKHYSFILVDTPPVISSTEARIFGKEGDGVVVVARLEHTPREVVKRSVDELNNSGANVIGCMLTDRKDHVPDLLYRMLGHNPADYYYDRYEDMDD
ncbi:MAG: CpsD/CapB family tyrosine-protein kinase [Planctomycetota bacterium]